MNAEQELIEFVAKAMFESPDPLDATYEPKPWPPSHHEDRAYMLNMAKCAIDAVREFDEREEHVETVWEFFESLPVGTWFGMPPRVRYRKTGFATVQIQDDVKVNYRDYWNSWEENVYFAMGGVIQGGQLTNVNVPKN